MIAYLLGHPSELDRLDAAGARDVIAAAVTEMMRRHAQTRMTVLWFDNLQWADPMLRDLLAVVVRSLADLPVPARHRPAPGRRRRVAAARRPPARAAACRSVRSAGTTPRRSSAASLDRDREADGAARRARCRRARRPRRRQPAVPRRAGRRWRPRATGSELPGSLRALIAARLDQLPAPQRAIVDNAAVLGSADSIGALVRFAQAMGQEFRDGDLAELAADGLLDVDGSWWRFRSDVVREVAYQTLTKRVRAQRHAGVAAVLAERGHNIDDVAHHAAAAAELRAELGPVDGVPSRSATHAIDGAARGGHGRRRRPGATTQAVRHASRALDLHGADSVDRAPAAPRAGHRRARAARSYPEAIGRRPAGARGRPRRR